ncbi:MAG: ABC transporter permease subunit [Anaerolineaceae bacterium]|nr:ABC transporter permease subunit [Anaerolineaceae bacterium]
MPLHLYIVRRFLFAIPLIIGITLVAFIIANAVPSDPVSANLPEKSLNDPEIVAAFRREWGLDKSLPEQYLTYIGNMLQGNLGRSIKTKRPVIQDIQQFLPATIELATTSIITGLILGVGMGVISAVWRGKLVDYITRVVALVGVSFPVFVLALLALSIFHAQLGWAAGPGRLDVRLSKPPLVTGLLLVDSIVAGRPNILGNVVSHLILPSLVLGVYTSGLISRITRSSMLEVLGAEYVRTARSKGLSERAVVMRHAFSNALIPVVTVIGLSFGNLLSGAVLTETIFSWPGIGRYAFQASTSQDFPAIMGISMLIAFIYVGVNFVVDILYFFLDPRIRLA